MDRTPNPAPSQPRTVRRAPQYDDESEYVDPRTVPPCHRQPAYRQPGYPQGYYPPPPGYYYAPQPAPQGYYYYYR